MTAPPGTSSTYTAFIGSPRSRCGKPYPPAKLTKVLYVYGEVLLQKLLYGLRGPRDALAADHNEIMSSVVVQRPQTGALFSGSDLVALLVDDAPLWTDVWTRCAKGFMNSSLHGSTQLKQAC